MRRLPFHYGWETLTGTYAPAFVGAAVLSLVASVLVLRITRPGAVALAPA